MTPIHDPVSALVYSALGHETSLVVIDGRVVMRDNVVLSANEAAIRQEAQHAAMALTRRAGIQNRNTCFKTTLP